MMMKTLIVLIYGDIHVINDLEFHIDCFWLKFIKL
jgi:hypothetical protein